MGDRPQRVVPATMRVAGEIVERFQLAEDRDIDGGAERLLQLGERGDSLPVQVSAEDVCVEGDGAHNVRVPAHSPFDTVL
jgi:hypothetical protein